MKENTEINSEYKNINECSLEIVGNMIVNIDCCDGKCELESKWK